MEPNTSAQDSISPFKTIRDLKVRDQYTIIKQIGDGVSGSVYLAENKVTQEKRAIKRILKSQLKDPIEYAQNEIGILMSLDHPNIVKMYETYEDKKSFCLVMEICQGGELFDAIVNREYVSERHAANIFRQMVLAVNYLHTNSIVHRDLKPENIMLYDEGPQTIVKLIDFGIAKQCFNSEQKLNTRSGSPYYVAPEILDGEYDKRVDIWALGIILHSMLVGYPPFRGNNDQEIYKEIRNGQLDFQCEEWHNISRDAANLVSQIIVKNPADRLTLHDVLYHPWLNAPESASLRMPLDMSNLRNYSAKLHFQKTILLAIARQLSESETRFLRDQFLAMDMDADGYINQNEFVITMEQAGMDYREAEQAWSLLSSNGERERIGYSEFIAASVDQSLLLSEKNLESTFKLLDRDGDGLVTSEDLDIVLTESSRPLWEDMLSSTRKIGYTGPRGIDFRKFSQLVSAASRLT